MGERGKEQRTEDSGLLCPLSGPRPPAQCSEQPRCPLLCQEDSRGSLLVAGLGPGLLLRAPLSTIGLLSTHCPPMGWAARCGPGSPLSPAPAAPAAVTGPEAGAGHCLREQRPRLPASLTRHSSPDLGLTRCCPPLAASGNISHDVTPGGLGASLSV